jgi:hypothetical protein
LTVDTIRGKIDLLLQRGREGGGCLLLHITNVSHDQNSETTLHPSLDVSFKHWLLFYNNKWHVYFPWENPISKMFGFDFDFFTLPPITTSMIAGTLCV